MRSCKVQASIKVISSIIYGYQPSDIDKLNAGEGILTKTGAKLYGCGGGWYRVSGYAFDGRDVREVVDMITTLK